MEAGVEPVSFILQMTRHVYTQHWAAYRANRQLEKLLNHAIPRCAWVVLYATLFLSLCVCVCVCISSLHTIHKAVANGRAGLPSTKLAESSQTLSKPAAGVSAALYAEKNSHTALLSALIFSIVDIGRE